MGRELRGKLEIVFLACRISVSFPFVERKQSKIKWPVFDNPGPLSGIS